MTRREFLRLLGSAGIAMPALIGPSGCAPVLTRTDTNTGLSLCCVAGDVTPDGAVVWLRAEADSEVFLQYSKELSLSDFAAVGPFPVDRDADFTAHVKLENLQPATVYYYRAAVSGKQPGPIAHFVTAPGPDDLAKVSFCCSGDTERKLQTLYGDERDSRAASGFFPASGRHHLRRPRRHRAPARRVLGEISCQP